MAILATSSRNDFLITYVPHFSPNEGFLQQLKLYESLLNKKKRTTTVIFKCKRCRGVVFTSDHLLSSDDDEKDASSSGVVSILPVNYLSEKNLGKTKVWNCNTYYRYIL